MDIWKDAMNIIINIKIDITTYITDINMYILIFSIDINI